mgnify:CR=1 FL=1
MKTQVDELIRNSNLLVVDLQEVIALLEAIVKRLNWLEREVNASSSEQIDSRMLSALYNVIDSFKNTALNYEVLIKDANFIVMFINHFTDRMNKFRPQHEAMQAKEKISDASN